MTGRNFANGVILMSRQYPTTRFIIIIVSIAVMTVLAVNAAVALLEAVVP